MVIKNRFTGVFLTFILLTSIHYSNTAIESIERGEESSQVLPDIPIDDTTFWNFDKKMKALAVVYAVVFDEV